ncbi:MAG: FHA domain-containing protein [Georgenia sp.]
MSVEYRPGTGTAVVTDGFVVLLRGMNGSHRGVVGPAAVGGDDVGADAVAVRLFRAGRPTGSLADWADRWAGDAPDLAVVAHRGGSLHVLVRGEAVVRAGERLVRDTGGTTEELSAGTGCTVVLGTEPADRATWLPVTGGVVRADGLRQEAAEEAADDSPGANPEDTWQDEGDAAPSRLAAPSHLTEIVTPATPVTPSSPRSPAGPWTPAGTDRREKAPVTPDPVFEVVLSTGRRIPVAGPVLVGRAPQTGRFPAGAAPCLVVVPNPERDISATHLELRPAADHVVATDMNSTNGTVVHLPGRPPARLRPGAGVPVPPGGVIELSTEVRLTVARIDSRAPHEAPRVPGAGA